MKISLPNPCTEPLDDMKPTQGGLYCDSCATTVIDFRDWDKEDIQAYFKHKKEKSCGIFYVSQVTDKIEPIVISPKINYSQLSFSQRFLFALFICFGAWLFGCKEPVSDPPVDHVVGMMVADSIPEAEKDSIGFDAKTKKSSHKGKVKYINSCSDYAEQETGIQNKSNDMDTLLKINIVDEPSLQKNEQLVFGGPEIQARFPGGEDSLYAFVKRNLIYPEYERLNKIEGRVYVRFTIDEEGNVGEPKILRSVNGALNFDAEVTRIIQLMPKWKPGRIGDKNIKQNFTLPIEFKL